VSISDLPDLQLRIRADLRAALRARRTNELSVLRALAAALDDAQSVPVGTLHERYTVRAFGELGVEVPRRLLTDDDVRSLLKTEIETRRDAASVYEANGRSDQAEKLSGESDIIARYLAS
jgi:uncharacterized protein